MRKLSDGILNSKFGRGADRFCNSPFYIAAIGASCILSHLLNIPVVGALLLTILVVTALIFSKNSFTLVPFIMMCSFVMSEQTKPQSGYYGTPLRITALCIMLAFLAAAFFFNIIYYGKWKLIFKRAYLTVSLSVITAALITGGLFSGAYSLGSIVLAVMIALTMFVPYSFLVNCGIYEGKKTVKYLCWTLVAVAVVVGVAIFNRLALNDFYIPHAKWFIYLGYAGPNTSAAFIAITIPATFYLIYVYKHGYLLMPIVCFEAACIYVTTSRASLIAVIITALIAAIIVCVKKKTGRIGYFIALGLVVIAVGVLCGVYWDSIRNIIRQNFVDHDFDGGRGRLWSWGLEYWKEHPIFGFGYKFIENFDGYADAFQHSFHCTPISYLYASGIVGLLAYLYHRYKTVRLVLGAKLNAERIFISLSVIAILINALLDIGMSSPQHILYYSILLAFIECDVNASKTRSSVEAPVDESKCISEKCA